MYCVSCKSSTRVPGARYCGRCGAPLQSGLWSDGEPAGVEQDMDAVEAPLQCPRCGRGNPETHVHCAHCGSRLEGELSGRARPADAVRAAELVADARRALGSGSVATARDRCEQAVGLDPRSAEGHALLSEILQRQGSLGGALHEMTAALRCDPDNREFESRLRQLREEQDRIAAPLLRGLDEPALPRQAARRPAIRLPRGPRWDGNVPEWARAAALILAAMLLMALLPRLMFGLRDILGLIIGALITLFVYRDARSLGMPLPVTLLWAGLIFVTTFFMGWYGLIAFLAYLLTTRMRR